MSGPSNSLFPEDHFELLAELKTSEWGLKDLDTQSGLSSFASRELKLSEIINVESSILKSIHCECLICHRLHYL